MTDNPIPDWLEGWKPAEQPQARSGKPGNPAWHKGMESPWPKGRPRGSTPQTKLIQRMLDGADHVVDAVMSKAMEGDAGSASLVLSRILPALRSQSQTVTFDFDPAAPISRQVEQILEAVSAGQVPPDVGKQLIEAVQALSAIRVAEELEARIAQLEEKA